MRHLTIDEMIDFVSFDKIDKETINQASKVNTHILKCESCRKKIHAFQIIYDELIRLGKSADFREMVRRGLSKPSDDTNPDFTKKLDVYR